MVILHAVRCMYFVVTLLSAVTAPQALEVTLAF
jgi:hypothetical protein